MEMEMEMEMGTESPQILAVLLSLHLLLHWLEAVIIYMAMIIMSTTTYLLKKKIQMFVPSINVRCHNLLFKSLTHHFENENLT